MKTLFVVIALSKIENLKAIHNQIFASSLQSAVVIALSKIENLKAIHNCSIWRKYGFMLLLHYRS